MSRDLRALLQQALHTQAGAGVHAELARRVVLAILVAELFAGSAHSRPPHADSKAPQHVRASRAWRPARGSLSGRRARG